MTVQANDKAPASLLIGVFFLSFAGLMFEVSLSRLLSIALWHHFAFLIISCALLGYGTAGAWGLIWRRSTAPSFPAACFALTLLPLFYLSQWISFDPAMLPLDPSQWINLIVLFLLFCIPFFFIGSTINLLLTIYAADAFRLYGFDLAGAAAGCGGFFAIAPFYTEVEWLLIISMFGAVALFLLSEQNLRRLFSCVVALVLAIVWHSDYLPPLRMSPYKSLQLALKYPGSETLQTKWNAVSRVDWFKSPLARFAPGLSLNYSDELPEQIGIAIDGDSLTAFTPWNGRDQRFIHHLPGEIVYKFTPKPTKVLHLNVLGGQSALASISHHVPNIQVQTENAALAKWLLKQAPPPQITIRAEKARMTLYSGSHAFDRIIVSLEGALPTGATGASVLQESRLETIEGVTSILNNLSRDGWASFHRYLLPPPRAELRLAVTLVEAMTEMRWNAERHLGVFRTISTIMFLVSTKEWTTNDRRLFLEFCSEHGYTPVYYPGMKPEEANQRNRFQTPIYADAIRQIVAKKEDYLTASIFNLKPATDDRPFFYNFLRLDRILETYQLFGEKWEALMETGLLIPGAFFIVLIIVGCVICIPLIFLPNKKELFPPGNSYFFWIGLAFMGVEIALFEKLTHFLGEPTYSFALALGCLLITSGIGSGLSGRFSLRLINICHAGLVVILIMYGFIVDLILNASTGSSFAARFCIAFLVTGAVGFMMGIPFPRGIAAISKGSRKKNYHSQDSLNIQSRITSAWRSNGFASVIGSTGAMLLAQYFGITSLFFWAALFYTLSYIALKKI